MSDTRFTVGDTWPALTGTITDNGAPVDLTTAESVQARILRPSKTMINRVVTVTDADAGEWSMPLVVGDLSEQGVYRMDLLVDWPGGAQTFGRDWFYTRDQLDGATSTGSNLSIPQGEDWAVAWPVTDEDGTPVDLTGWTVVAQVRPSVESATVLYEWNTDDGSATVTGGMVSLLVPNAVSSGWVWTDGVYDVELTSPDDAVTRVDGGWVTVLPEVTR